MNYAILNSEGRVSVAKLSEANLPKELEEGQQVSFRGHIYNTAVTKDEIGPGAWVEFKTASGKITRELSPNDAFYVDVVADEVSDLVELVRRIERRLGYIEIDFADEFEDLVDPDPEMKM